MIQKNIFFFNENHLLNILEEIKQWYMQIKEGYEKLA